MTIKPEAGTLVICQHWGTQWIVLSQAFGDFIGDFDGYSFCVTYPTIVKSARFEQGVTVISPSR